MIRRGIKETAMIVLSAGIGRNPVFASKNIEIHNVSINEFTGKLTGYVVGLLHYAGAALLIWGVGSFMMSIKTDDAQSKNVGIMCAVTGAILFSIRWFLKAVGLATG